MIDCFNKSLLKEKRKFLRNNMTISERMLWEKIKGKQLLGVKFRRQCSIGNYIVDFFTYDQNLVIEIDGDSHFLTEEAKKYDKKRSDFLNSLGLRIIRFTNIEIKNNLTACIEKLITVIENTPPNLP